MRAVRWLYDLLSSVRFGITLLVLLFFYMSIGSAGVVYPVHPNLFHPDAWVHDQLRQWRPFEMTEFEWFHWWPFNLLVGLIAANMIVTTLRRIPFRVVNLGVWMIHTGIIVLIVGSVHYFNAKVEGDAPVARRKIVLEADGSDGSVELLAATGARAVIGDGAGQYSVEVVDIDPAWTLRTDGSDGEPAYSVTVSVQTAARRFMRQLIAGRPDLTEDLLPGSGPGQPMQRSVKATGSALVDGSLRMRLDYETQGWFYLRNDLAKAWAVYVRPAGSSEWTMRPVEGLPLYNDRVSSVTDVLAADPASAPLRPMLLPVPPAAGDPFPDVTIAVDGYLRYAQLRSLLVPGGANAPFNPTATLDITGDQGAASTYRLMALDSERSTADDGLLRMAAVSSEADFEKLLKPAEIRVRIPAAGVDVVQAVRVPKDGAGADAFVPVGDPLLGYGYRIRAAQDDLPVAGRSASVLIMDVKTPGGVIRRWVFDDAALTRDVPGGDGGHASPVQPDPAVQVDYTPGGGRALLTLVAGPEERQLRLIAAFGDAAGKAQPIEVGGSVRLPAGLTVELSSYEPRARVIEGPVPIPLEQRIRDAREMFSMAHIIVPGAAPLWVRFSPYAFDDVRFALRRHPFHPQRVRLADGREMDILFSRQRLPLGTDVALEDFVLATHSGGYTGESGTIRDYTSVLRFRDGADESWSEPTQVSVNAPVEHRGLWFFQAQWDPPEPVSARDPRGSAGLNYTVLGVGNREGVWTQLAGCVIAVAGMTYAFYVKPLLIRRRTERAKEAAKRRVALAGAMS